MATLRIASGTSSAAPPTRRQRRTLVRRLLLVGAVVALGAGLSAAGVLALLASPVGRPIACDFLRRQLHDVSAGDLRIGRCAVLRPDRLRFEDVTLRSATGELLVSVAALEVHPSLAAAMRGELRVDSAIIEKPVVSLVRQDGELALWRAFQPAQPPPATTTNAASTPQPATWTIREVLIQQGRAEHLPGDVAVRAIDAALSVTLGALNEIVVHNLRAEVVRDGTAATLAVGAHGALFFVPGRRSWLDAKATLGQDDLDTQLGFTWGDQGLSDFEATLHAALSSDSFSRLGWHVLAQQLKAKMRLSLRAQGDLDNLSFRGELASAGGTAAFSGDVGAERRSLRVDMAALRFGEVFRGGSGTATMHLEAVELPRHAAVEISTDVLVQDARFLDFAAERLLVRGNAHGKWVSPTMAASVEGTNVVWKNTKVDSVELHVAGGPTQYLVTASTKVNHGPTLELATSVAVARETYVLSGDLETSDLWSTIDPYLSQPRHPSLEAVKQEANPFAIHFVNVAFEPRRSVSVGELQLHGSGLDAVLHGRYRASRDVTVDLRVNAVDLGGLAAALGMEPPLAGIARGTVHAQGRWDDPAIDAEVTLAGFRVANLTPFDVAAKAQVRQRRGVVDLTVSDQKGEVASAQVRAYADLRKMIEGRGLQASMSVPWSLTLQVKERPLDAYSGLSSVAVAPRMRVDVELQGGGRPLAGHVLAHADFREVKATAGCNAGTQPEVVLDVEVRENHADIALSAAYDGHQALTVAAQASFPRGMLLGGQPFSVPTLDVRAQLDALDISRLPFVCQKASGTLTGTITALRMLTASPSVSVDLQGKDFALAGYDPLGLHVVVGATGSEAQAHVSLTQPGRQVLDATAKVPLQLAGAWYLPQLAPGPVNAEISLDQAPLAFLLAPVPAVAHAGGTVDGHLRFTGPALEQLSAEGRVELHDATVVINDPFVRLEHLDGKVAIQGDELTVSNLTMRDQRGSLHISGTAGLDGVLPTTVDFTLTASDYPLRREGVIFAFLDGGVQVEGRLDSDPRRLDVKLENLSVALTEQVGQNFQELAQHKDVIYENQPGFVATAAPSAEVAVQTSAKASGGSSVPWVVAISSTTPVWLRQGDLAAQVSVMLRLTAKNDETRLAGPVKVLRGTLTLLGKEFHATPGTLHFADSVPIDAELDLAAVHDLPSARTVTLHVGGRLRAPVLSFSSSDPSVTSQAEIIGLLVGGGVGAQQNRYVEEGKAQALAILGGVISGVVGSLGRQWYGKLVPVLSIASDGTTGATSVRAGFRADDLIPSGLRKLILALFIQGSVGGASQAEPMQVGVLLQLFHPHDLSTTAAYRQAGNWSFDFLWAP